MHDPIYVTQGLTYRSFALPIHLRWRHRFYFVIGVSLISGFFYFTSNHIHWKLPRVFSLGWIDQSIPFIPWTIWIYFSGIFYLGYALAINRCLVSLAKHLYSYFFIVVLSSVGFILYPVAYPRELFPLPATLDPWTEHLFTWIRTIDSPANCTPSLHVSVSFLVALGFLDDRRGHFPVVFTWALLLAISTLTTKQHYFVDVVLGVLQAGIFFLLFHRLLQYRLRDSAQFPIPLKQENPQEKGHSRNPLTRRKSHPF